VSLRNTLQLQTYRRSTRPIVLTNHQVSLPPFLARQRVGLCRACMAPGQRGSQGPSDAHIGRQLHATKRHLRCQQDYSARPWPSEADAKVELEWLYQGKINCTARDARCSTYAAIEAVLSILVEVPIERVADETAILNTLQYAKWRVPCFQRCRVAGRMARHGANLINGVEFVPAGSAS
jgi:hypothetical protein